MRIVRAPLSGCFPVSHPITFSVATNDEAVLRENFLASPLAGLKQVQILLQRDFRSAAAAYNDAIDKSENDLIVFAHQDIYFPAGWIEQLCDAVALLEKQDPNWGVLGCYGITHDGQYRGHLCSSTQGIHGTAFDQPLPVQTLDEIVLIIRKSSGLRFDESLPSFHFYGADLCLEASKLGKQNYAICAPCIHNTRQGFVLPAVFYECYSYMRRKWLRALPVQTTCIRITKSNRDAYMRRLRELHLRLVAKPPAFAPKTVDTLLRQLETSSARAGV